MAQKVIKRKTRNRGRNLPTAGLPAVVEAVTKAIARNTSDFGNFTIGDSVKIFVKIREGEKERLQAFEGVVMAMSNRGAGKTFTVRKISHGVGVERIFMFSSPRIARVEVIQVGRVRRAKLYYLRGLEGKKARIDRDMRVTKEAAPVAAATTEA